MHRVIFRRMLFIALATVATACGSGDTTNVNPGSITLSLTPTTATIQRGGSTQVSGTVTRSNFTGDVAISVTGAPTGVTGTVTLAPVNGGNTAQVTLSAATSTSPGTYTLTVTASGSGVSNATATFTLTITAATPASFTMALGTPTLSVGQGASGQSAITLTRTAFTGNVTLSAENLPTGVTASFTTNPVPATTSSVTFNVAANAAPGTFNTILIRGTAPGLTDVTAPVTLTITVTGNFAIAAGSNPLNVAQGAQATTTLNATRSGGFSGTIVYTVTGPANAALPAGLTAAVTPTATADQNTLMVTATSGLAVGSYPIVVHGIAFGIEQTASLNVAVATPAGQVRLDYSQCTAATKPIWVGYQDGTNAFVRTTGTADVYQFNIAAAKGAFAVVTQNGAQFSTVVQYFSQSEIAGLAATCTAIATTKTINGTLNGVTGGFTASVSMGGGAATAVGPATTYQLTGVTNGSHDLVAYNRNVATPGAALDRLIIRRALNIADGGSMPLLDFTGGDVMLPTTVTINVNGATAGNTVTQNQAYLTGTSCTPHALYTKTGTTNSIFVYGVPVANQLASDFYSLGVTEQLSSTSSRNITTSFHTLANGSVTMPAAINPTVSIIASAQNNFRLIQSVFTLPSDYLAATLTYTDTPGNSYTIFQSSGYIAGAGTVTLAATDLGSVTGYLPSWGPAKTSATNFISKTLGGTFGSACTEGATSKTATVTGIFPLA